MAEHKWMCLNYRRVISLLGNLLCYRHAWVAITTAAAISVTAGGHGQLKEQCTSHLSLTASLFSLFSCSTITFCCLSLSSSFDSSTNKSKYFFFSGFSAVLMRDGNNRGAHCGWFGAHICPFNTTTVRDNKENIRQKLLRLKDVFSSKHPGESLKVDSS